MFQSLCTTNKTTAVVVCIFVVGLVAILACIYSRTCNSHTKEQYTSTGTQCSGNQCVHNFYGTKSNIPYSLVITDLEHNSMDSSGQTDTSSNATTTATTATTTTTTTPSKTAVDKTTPNRIGQPTSHLSSTPPVTSNVAVETNAAAGKGGPQQPVSSSASVTTATDITSNSIVNGNTKTPAIANNLGYPTGTNNEGSWDKCYFFSGGDEGSGMSAYTEDHIGKKTASGDSGGVPNINPNGADPSCGSADPTFWNAMGITAANAESTTKYKYVAPYSILAKHAKQKNTGKICNNCTDRTNKLCDGRVQLVNSSKGPSKGKVACFAHGNFGASLDEHTSCTTGHYDKGLPKDTTEQKDLQKDVFSHRSAYLGLCVKYVTNMMSQCDPPVPYAKDNGILELFKGSCLIKKKAFDSAFKSASAQNHNFYPTEYEPSNDGIAIAWGHGATDGGCGSVHLMYSDDKNSKTNLYNTIMVYQIGTRAWSGEWTDNVCNQTATYLVEGMPGAANSQTGLQPMVKRIDNRVNGGLDILLNYLCEVWIPPGSSKPLASLNCTPLCMGKPGSSNPVGCATITDKGVCLNASGSWGCEWTGNDNWVSSCPSANAQSAQSSYQSRSTQSSPSQSRIPVPQQSYTSQSNALDKQQVRTNSGNATQQQPPTQPIELNTKGYNGCQQAMNCWSRWGKCCDPYDHDHPIRQWCNGKTCILNPQKWN